MGIIIQFLKTIMSDRLIDSQNINGIGCIIILKNNEFGTKTRYKATYQLSY